MLLVFTSCSCGLSKTHATVLEVRSEQLNSDILKHTFDIEGNPIISINEQKRGDKKTVVFGSKKYDLEYKETIEYIIGGVSVDEYVTVDNNKGKVLLLPNGEIYAILGSTIGQIEIESTADALTVRQAVETYLKEELDFDFFKYCDVTCSLPDTSYGFGLYSFVWSNKIGDIGTDQTLNLSVSQNGEITALWMKYCSQNSFQDVSRSITNDDFQNKIKDKINSIYGDYLIEWSVFSSVLTHYDGNVYLDCTMSVSYCNEDAEELSEACRLLIPVE